MRPLVRDGHLRCQMSQSCRQVSCELQPWLSGIIVDDFNVSERWALNNVFPKRFDGGLLRGKSPRQKRVAIVTNPVGFKLLWSKHPIQEAVAMPLDDSPHTHDFHQVDTDRVNHILNCRNPFTAGECTTSAPFWQRPKIRLFFALLMTIYSLE